jgi:hypothetical protein
VAYPEPDLDGLPDVTVLRCGRDYGPGTKLIPALSAEPDPDTVIVTIDDDVAYAPAFFSHMIDAKWRLPSGAVGFCGWNAGPLIAGGFYDFVYEERAEHPDGQMVDVLEGYRGVAYRRGDFGDDVVEFMDSLPAEAMLVDDVWICGYLAKKGVARRVARYLPDRRLTEQEVWGRVWKQYGLAPEAQGLRNLGDTVGRNRRIAALVF